MKIGFEISFQNDEMTINAPNLFTYVEDASSAQVINHDKNRITSEAIMRTMLISKVYKKCLRLSYSLEKEVNK